MKASFFSGKKSLEIISDTIKNNIKKKIQDIGSFNLTSKYYTFLNKKNVYEIKNTPFLISLSTFGKKFILFITIYNTKKYCIFINKKNDVMTVTQLKFQDDIFEGTLFDGELVKNSNDKWIYLINDISYYKGKSVITKSFLEREEIIENILAHEHENSSHEQNETFYISKKKYFEFKYMKELVYNYIDALNYKCSGLYFKNIDNFSDNYLFIFPECRSDSKILQFQDLSKEIETEKSNEIKTYIKSNGISPTSLDSKISIEESKTYKQAIKLEKTTCRFLLISTLMPDIYELHCKNTNNDIEKHSYASVPDIDTSNFIKNILQDQKEIYVECTYHKSFKKWIPFKKVDTVDSITTINQIQIILDSL